VPIEGSITGERNIEPITVPIDSAYTNISINSQDSHYPLKIGLDGNTPSFRVGWAGDVHIERGSLKGAYIEGSLIKGSDIFANYVQANRGWLGGWVIDSGKIQSPPDGTTFWTVLDPKQGITTNHIKLSTKSTLDDSDV